MYLGKQMFILYVYEMKMFVTKIKTFLKKMDVNLLPTSFSKLGRKMWKKQGVVLRLLFWTGW